MDYLLDIPQFTDNKVLKCVYVRDNRKERVFVFKKENIWGTWQEVYYDNDYETGWYGEDFDSHKYNSKETAIKELKGNYPWAKDQNTIIKEL